MIVVTGAAGFIGSCMVSKLNLEGFVDIILVDDFSRQDKENNLVNKKFTEKVDRNHFFEWIIGKENQIQFIFHIGARTDTTEFDVQIFDDLNVNYSKKIWTICSELGIPLIYASSAATYGMGEFGFDDDYQPMSNLKPLNPYGQSKLDFDIWALAQDRKPFFWAGFKFFNVYGPNEYHKGRMASVVLHAYRQIKLTGELKLFRSHNDAYQNGEQRRDFIYVKDLVNVLFQTMIQRKTSGLYNLGSGRSRTFNELAHAIFKSLDLEPKINFIDTPLDIRDKYQYFTEANMNHISLTGYEDGFVEIENGVDDYIKNFLMSDSYL
ncbi:MAG: ADP-glyceromanno-heptose 6-epimerase [Bacteroidota bacterium]|nr:ADP-glyceromanno-heptose 6-epimerase [Bacteroidota bacterium]